MMDFYPSLYLDPKKKYELALVNLETYDSIPNVTSSSNTSVYHHDSGTTLKTIALPEDSYKVAQIYAETQRQLAASGDCVPRLR